MSLYWRAQIIFMCLSALVAGGLFVKKAIHDSHTLPVEAVVASVDRHCLWKDENTGEVRRLPCNHDEVAGAYSRTDKEVHYLEGDAVIHFTYLAPQDMIERPGELAITGKDPRFYSLASGDPLAIRIEKEDAATYEVD